MSAEHPAAQVRPTFAQRVEQANAKLAARGSKRRVGYREGERWAFFVARASTGEHTFGAYDRLDDVLAAIATLDNSSLA